MEAFPKQRGVCAGRSVGGVRGHAWTDEVEEVLFEAAGALVTHDRVSATRRHVSDLSTPIKCTRNVSLSCLQFIYYKTARRNTH